MARCARATRFVTDGDGNLVLRDRGTIRETIVFDTEGDDIPGGIFIDEVDFHVSGPHPGLEFDPCSNSGDELRL